MRLLSAAHVHERMGPRIPTLVLFYEDIFLERWINQQ
jgi:hypothetical protein